LLAAFAIGLALVATRLIFIQTVEAGRFDRLARKQRMRTVNLAPQRGVIVDREGEALAMSEDVLTICATPYFVNNPGQVAARLSPLLRIKRAELLRRLTRPSGFSYIARKVPMPIARKIRAMDIPGLEFAPDTLRRYPNGRLASQVIGFVGTDNKGLAGLELYYEKILGGRPGQLVTEQDPTGRPIPGSTIKQSDPVNGEDLQLTLDRHIQYQAEVELERAVREWGAAGGTVVVMNPVNGELLALANSPSFNPNRFSEATTESLRNRAVTDAYEPGSTMKMITAATALQEQIVTPSTSFFLQSTIRVADRTIHEAHDRAARDFTVTDIVTHSSNVGAVTLGIKLGKTRLYRYIEAFGLTKRTGIDFPGESAGVMPAPKDWSRSTIGNVPFGQGIAATPIQMAQAMAVIANGGLRTRPHLLAATSAPDASPSSTSPRRVISKKTASQMRAILLSVVASGTGKSAAVSGYKVGGKTGTAQKPPYGSGKYLASFIGFAPAGRPRLVVIVAIDEPTCGIYGGTVAAPAFARITEYALKHLRIPPKP
jgi:cell division protein FtsI/penicillin-binding protein 2